MASNAPLCGVCETLERSSPSVVWCMVCAEGLCTECDKQHKASKGSNSHQTIPIDIYRDLPIDFLNISQTCLKHSEGFSSYCGLHECMCCVKCIIESHGECKALKPIDEVVRGIKTSHVFRECEENLSEINENVLLMITNRIENVSSLKQERKRIESKIRETKRKVTKHLDNLEALLITELITLEETKSAKIESLVSSLEKLEKDTTEMMNDFLNIKKHASEMHAFMAIKNIESFSSQKRETITKLSSSDNIRDCHLEVELNQILKDLEKSVQSFGRVSIESRPCNVVLHQRKEKQAQMHLPRVSSINNIELDLIWSVDVQDKGLYGCCFLPDGRYVVTSSEHNMGRILVMRENGTVDFQIDTYPYIVNDVTHIPSTNTLAAATGRSNQLIDLNSKKITRSIPSDTENYGITYKDGHLFYCAKKIGICKLNIDNGTVTTIKTIPDISLRSYIASYQDKLYYTDSDKHTVTCCSIEGTTRWEYKDENVLRFPRGLCTDNNGNVYVTGGFATNLVVLSSDGSRHSQLLSKKDGLNCLTAIDFDNVNNRLLFTNFIGNVFLYKIK